MLHGRVEIGKQHFKKKPLEKELGASFKFNKLVFGG